MRIGQDADNLKRDGILGVDVLCRRRSRSESRIAPATVHQRDAGGCPSSVACRSRPASRCPPIALHIAWTRLVERDDRVLRGLSVKPGTDVRLRLGARKDAIFRIVDGRDSGDRANRSCRLCTSRPTGGGVPARVMSTSAMRRWSRSMPTSVDWTLRRLRTSIAAPTSRMTDSATCPAMSSLPSGARLAARAERAAGDGARAWRASWSRDRREMRGAPARGRRAAPRARRGRG